MYENITNLMKLSDPYETRATLMKLSEPYETIANLTKRKPANINQ